MAWSLWTFGLLVHVLYISHSTAGQSTTFTIPSAVPTSAVTVDPALLSVSLEFFAFPGYMDLDETQTCLENLQALRGVAPAVRIGGTTQDRATFDPSLTSAVNFSVASPTDAPTTLTFGPSFFSLANELPGDVIIGLNRQLDNLANSELAAQQAKANIRGLLAIELGNEPDLYSATSPIAEGQAWNPSADEASQKSWFTSLSESVGNIFQGGVYISFPSWSISGLIATLGSSVNLVKTFSRHAYPQSACGGSTTNLQTLMSHTEIVSFVEQYTSEAKAVAAVGKDYYLGETNSATCGGGGISPTFGAGLWVLDYALQASVKGIQRLYFHQGTIGDCAYCFWGAGSIFAPYYGAVFANEFLGMGSPQLVMLDEGTSAIAAYAVFDSSESTSPSRILLYNSGFFGGSGSRGSTEVVLSDIGSTVTVTAKRLTAPNANALTNVSIGGNGSFDGTCKMTGVQSVEAIDLNDGRATVDVMESEAVIIFL